jgi:predicted ArsR family transcriptional regulator
VGPIPSDIKEFLFANIDSVDQLEILRLVVGEPQKEHSALSLAQELQIALQTVEAHVNALSARGLLTITNQQPLTCKHGPQTKELEAGVQELVKTYLERPVSLIKMVYEKPKEQIKTFADAFRLKKEK